MLLFGLEEVQAVVANKNRLKAKRDMRVLQRLSHPKPENVGCHVYGAMAPWRIVRT